ncbi:hypothetical protein UlMin_031377 [Ulmus minor]
MVVELCLMASHGYPTGVVLTQEQNMSRVFQDCQPLLPSHGARHEIMRLGSLKLRPHERAEPWKPLNGLSESNNFVKIDSAVKRPVLTDMKDAHPGSMLFSFGIAEHCVKQEKILHFLMSGTSELEKGGVDLASLSDLMGFQALKNDGNQQPLTPLIYPSPDLYAQKPLLDFVGDLVEGSRIMIHQDGRVLFNGTRTEMKDLLSVVAEFYLQKNSANGKKQSMLVPYYSRLDCTNVGVIVDDSLKIQAKTVAPLKSPGKVKVKSPKKKSKRAVSGRDLYQKNYLHACESLLSIMIDQKHGKTAIITLKRSGPELPEFLTQFSASIAGTGLAVLLSVFFKVAGGRVPFCSSKLFNTGFGFGLFWLSWAVNKLRDTIIQFSRNGGKLGLKEEEAMERVGKSFKEIYFRAAALMVVAVLRFV